MIICDNERKEALVWQRDPSKFYTSWLINTTVLVDHNIFISCWCTWSDCCWTDLWNHDSNYNNNCLCWFTSLCQVPCTDHYLYYKYMNSSILAANTNGGPYTNVIEKSCCRSCKSTWLRGAPLCCGQELSKYGISTCFQKKTNISKI